MFNPTLSLKYKIVFITFIITIVVVTLFFIPYKIHGHIVKEQWQNGQKELVETDELNLAIVERIEYGPFYSDLIYIDYKRLFIQTGIVCLIFILIVSLLPAGNLLIQIFHYLYANKGVRIISLSTLFLSLAIFLSCRMYNFYINEYNTRLTSQIEQLNLDIEDNEKLISEKKQSRIAFYEEMSEYFDISMFNSIPALFKFLKELPTHDSCLVNTGNLQSSQSNINRYFTTVQNNKVISWSVASGKIFNFFSENSNSQEYENRGNEYFPIKSPLNKFTSLEMILIRNDNYMHKPGLGQIEVDEFKQKITNLLYTKADNELGRDIDYKTNKIQALNLARKQNGVIRDSVMTKLIIYLDIIFLVMLLFTRWKMRKLKEMK